MRHPAVPFALAASLYAVLTAILTWPLVLHPVSIVPSDLGDPLLNAYLMAWNARVVPLTDAWWHLPQFYPARGVLAFSEHLLGLAPLTTPIIWVTGNALLAYNAAFFLSFVFCALSAHTLCYVVTRRHDVSVLAGLAYAFSPYRMSHFAHVQVLSSYWMPLALTGLHLFLQQHRVRWLVLFGLAWLLQALACGYYLFYLSALVGLWALWFALGRERPLEIGKIALAWVVAALPMIPIGLGYLRYSAAYGLKRWPDEIQAFSGDVASLLKAPYNLRLWGWLDVVDRPESQFFPGVTIVLLALVGLGLAWASAARERRTRLLTPRVLLILAFAFAAAAAVSQFVGPWRLEPFGVRILSVRTPQKPFSVALLLAVIALALHPSVRAAWRARSPFVFYAIAAVFMWLFALGPAPTLMNEPLLYKAPYSWLMLLPGVDGVRVPARFWMLATLCLAMAGALGLRHVIGRWPRTARVLVPLACVVVLAEAWPRPMRFERPPAPRPALAEAAARLEFPVIHATDPITLYRAIDHRRPTLNGYSGYFAPHYAPLQYLLHSRNPQILERLAALGPIEVIVDRQSDYAREFRAYMAAYPGVEVLHDGPDYAAYRIPAGRPWAGLPLLSGDPLPVASIRASLYQDRVGHMLDGDRISRWDTGGPQSPDNEMTIELSENARVTGVEMQIAGYVADFPRHLAIETSLDGLAWIPAWEGEAALTAFSAALEKPLETPLRFPIEPRDARFVRLRQTSRDRTYYWSVAELRIHGTGQSSARP
jgi:hypothetical protein